MDQVKVEIRVTLPDRTSIRAPLFRDLTSIGASPASDVRVAGLPPEWAVVDRRGGLTLLRCADRARFALAPGQPCRVDGVEVVAVDVAAAAPPAPRPATATVAELATTLAGAESPAAAMTALLDWTLAWADGDAGAVVAREDGGYAVIATRDAAGRPLADPAALLSDTVVRDVLASACPIRLDDSGADPRYRAVHSVVNLALRSLACVPMPLGREVVGALLIGRNDLRRPLPPELVGELAVIAAMASSLVVQLRRHRAEPGPPPLVGDSPPLQAVRRAIERLGPYDLSVQVTGPSGSGKELVAQALHRQSPRAAGPLVALNCAAVAPTLLEAELFGYRKGAFTGATADRIGKLEAAHGGTLFLDEIGDCPLPMQAALLRALQEREVVRIGDTAPRPVDFRLITATHKDLAAEVAAGRFRADLMFRLREVVIELPPLAACGDDVLLLARLFLRQAEHELRLPARRLGAAAAAALLAHPWPGNVRELRGVMRRAAVMADGDELAVADLGLVRAAAPATPAATPAAAPATPTAAPATPAAAPAPPLPSTEPSVPAALAAIRPLAEARDEFVTSYVLATLASAGGDRAAAAAQLGISVRSLYRYLGE